MLVRITGESGIGEPPKWVKKAWIGLLLEGISMDEYLRTVSSAPSIAGARTRKPTPRVAVSGDDFVTPTDVAVERLRDKSQKAASWWDKYKCVKGVPLAGLIFPRGSFEVILP
jgi:hypothetical protein